MKVLFDITQPIFEQSKKSFKVVEHNGSLMMNPSIGDGGIMRNWLFPGALEFYHYGKTVYRVPVEMKSVNPPDSDWYVIHINLSNVQQNKQVGNEKIEFHKYHPAGILLYGPGLEINTYFPIGTEAEVCGMRFSGKLLREYFSSELEGVRLDKPLVYEDLDPDLEKRLMLALSDPENKATAHSRVLDFLSAFIRKLKKHAPVENTRLAGSDYRELMKVAAVLRNPSAPSLPTQEELAAQAGMSLTKFKQSFKQVFGCPPKQYHLKIRLEYAREQLRQRRKTPVELAHELGYSHPSNFTSAYKKYFSVLPSVETG